jgi:hypothetical protein
MIAILFSNIGWTLSIAIVSSMLTCTFVSRNSKHSFSMRLPGRFCRKSSVRDDDSSRDSHELPRFSFEGDGRPLVSTDRLFHQWSEDGEIAYNPGFHTIENALKLEQDIVVCKLPSWSLHNADAYCRSHGMARTTLPIPSTGLSQGSG